MADEKQNSPPNTEPAAAFEKFLVPTIFGPWSEALINHASTFSGEKVLDIGCGTGAASRYAAEIVGEKGLVSAIDVNAGMIEFARNLAPDVGIDWRVANVDTLPFSDRSFDLVAGNQILQFLPDKSKALSEIKRVLFKDGRIALSVYCKIELCPAHCAVARALEKFKVDPAGILNPYSFNDPLILGDFIQDAGFRDVSVVRKSMESRFLSPEHFVQSLAAGGPSARHALEQLNKSELVQVITEVTETLANFVEKKGLRVITASHFALGRV